MIDKEIIKGLKERFLKQIEERTNNNKEFKTDFKYFQTLEKIKDEFNKVREEAFGKLLEPFYSEIIEISKALFKECPKCLSLNLEDIKQEITLAFFESLIELNFEQTYLS